MPDYSINKLRVTGPIEERQRLTDLWTDDGGEVFNRILPRPRELADEAWYKWQCRHWGTDRDVGGQEDPVVVQERDGETTIFFYTAWTPPIPVIQAMSAIYSSLTFDMVFFEPYAGFAGKARFIGGKGGHYYFDFGDGDMTWILRDLGFDSLALKTFFPDLDEEAIRNGEDALALFDRIRDRVMEDTAEVRLAGEHLRRLLSAWASHNRLEECYRRAILDRCCELQNNLDPCDWLTLIALMAIGEAARHAEPTDERTLLPVSWGYLVDPRYIEEIKAELEKLSERRWLRGGSRR